MARTATNVRAGARGPVAGMLHALYLLLFMLVAAPLAAYIPLASLGAVLAIVAWNMVEKEEFRALLRTSRGDAAVLLVTFLLTIFEDLALAIAAGVTLGAFLFLHRMAEAVEVETGQRLMADDVADTSGAARTAYDPDVLEAGVVVYRISGAFFFGAAAAVSSALDGIGEHPRRSSSISPTCRWSTAPPARRSKASCTGCGSRARTCTSLAPGETCGEPC